MSSDQGVGEYRGIKRTQQACLNCRRKKAKCSGGKPVCEYCKRLSQECRWGGRTSPDRDMARHDEDDAKLNGFEALSTRVTMIESKLDSITDMLTTYLPALLSRAQESPSNSAASQPPAVHRQSPISSYAVDHPNGAAIPSTIPSTTTDQRFRILPPLEILNYLIDLYFTHVQNQPYSFFHEQSFRHRLALGVLPNYLLFAVVASAVRFSSDPYFEDAKNEAARIYASESWKLIVSVWFGPENDPDICLCQAVTMLSIIDFTAGRRHPGWLKIGLSIRIAQDLQLMTEPSVDLNFAEQEERRRVFWSIYVLDKLCSCGRSRPLALADVYCFVQLPSDEMKFRNGEWMKMPTLEQAFSTSDSNGESFSDLSLMIMTSSILGRCAQYSIHQNLRGESRLPPWDSQSVFATIYSALLQLETRFELGNNVDECSARLRRPDGTIDMQLAGPIIFSRVLFRTCHCILHHPLLLHQQSRVSGTKPPHSFWKRAMQTSRENACSLSEFLRDVESSGYTINLSFVGYCATVSASIHSMYLQDPDVKIQQKASECFQYNMKFLKGLANHWKNAAWMLIGLEKLAEQSKVSAKLLMLNPSWDSFNAEQLEILQATIDYNTMSQAPQDSKVSKTPNVASPWDPFSGTDMAASYNSNLFQHDMAESNLQLNTFDDGLGLNMMSPFTSFFSGGPTNFGG